ncbi:hypothetical protein [Virgisporangium ochraceum]|uniref:Uncharacterized protein n=1 Tax=Virgisporangium ochraceum TaxID=65505 RepID=A0A8J4EEZ8_9ACTN|nr:hypothetical protein [Virgisporangium ochraceum]GIJ72294.1 hypothetical protein Voc01_072110 [Virgisporangium ochraceum]
MSYGYGHPYPAYAPAPAYPPAQRRSAPPGVHVLAILQYLSGAATLAIAAVLGWAAVVVGNGTYDTAPSGPYTDEILDNEGAAILFGVIAGVIAVFGLITIFLGRKLQRGRQWARVIVLMLSLLSLAGVVASVAINQRIDVSVAGVAYPVLCLVLLNTTAARNWFRYRTW